MHRIDDSFRVKKEAERRARRGRRLRILLVRLAVGCLLIAGGIGGFWLYETGRNSLPPPAETAAEAEALSPAYASTILDIAGDPLRIEIGGVGGHSQVRSQDPPEAIARLGMASRINILQENILPSSERLVTAIPSTPQDFAFFDAQRRTAEEPPAPTDETPADSPAQPDGSAALSADPAATPSNGGWSDIATANLNGSDGSFKKTEIEDNTSTVVLIADQFRSAQTEDDFRRVIAEAPAEDFLMANGVTEAEAKAAAVKFKETVGTDVLAAGSVAAMRYLNDRTASTAIRRLVQIAFYEPERFVGAFALDDAGTAVAAADPWVGTNIFRMLNEPADGVMQQKYRLLDAIYSVGLRNGVSTSVIGEAIMYLSRGHDLGQFAGPEDVLTLVFSGEGRDTVSGRNRVLFIGVHGPNTTIRCFVFQPAGSDTPACFDTGDTSGTIEIANGMVTPVAGVMTSTFGPRRHPILGKVLMHEGVDWAAPLGTAVRAAYAGRIAFAGSKGTFGNFIQIEQGADRAAGYAHLNGFAPGIEVGKAVKAGDLIGYVGTTGQSTGPHLHFEYYLGGKPIDPLQTMVAANDSGGEAVEMLVDRIVHVESGGNASAANPLSTAVGLGQFIESTWMRMMRTYRPDLATSLDRDKLLALRVDPTLSREMIGNLARENKAYLESGGQTVTAGRLYLAHFLGPEGARTVLSAADSDALDTVLGVAVIQANPFLTGKDVAYVKNWADNKMRGRGASGSAAITQKVEQASPEFTAYREAVIGVMGG